MLEELSPHQVSLLPRWRDDWIAHALSTAPADREAAEAGVDMAYQAAGLEPPRIRIWLGSPYQGNLAAMFLAGGGLWLGDPAAALIPTQVQAQLRDSVEDGDPQKPVWDQLHRQLMDRFSDRIWAKVRIPVWRQVQDQVVNPVNDRISRPILSLISEMIWNPSRDSERSRHVRVYYGQIGAGLLSLFDYFDRVAGIEEAASLRGWGQVARSCGCWWPFRDVVILTDRPETLHRDAEGRLHATDGMALRYRDGWGIHAVHGVRVPAHVIEAPEGITPEAIEAEANTEIRRVMIERYKPGAEIGGAAAYLLDSGAREIDRAAGVTKDPIVLYRKDVAGDEPILMLGMKNATPEPDGRVRDYFLRVPPDMTRAAEAMAWTFGLSGRDYRPDIET